jgi:hypothetical protein
MTREELAQILAHPGYTIGHAGMHPALAPRLPDAQPQRASREELLDSHEGEKARAGRLEVRITRRGTKLLDKDNLYGGVKYACDALRYAGLIPEDDPEAIELIVTQEKVRRKDCGTVIVIEPI